MESREYRNTSLHNHSQISRKKQRMCYKDERAVAALWTKVYVKLHNSIRTQITYSREYELIKQIL